MLDSHVLQLVKIVFVVLTEAFKHFLSHFVIITDEFAVQKGVGPVHDIAVGCGIEVVANLGGVLLLYLVLDDELHE